MDMPVEVGISKVLGMQMFKAGDVQDYETKAAVAAEKLNDLDAVYVHIKGPDEIRTRWRLAGKETQY